MAGKLELLLEAERRGILPENKKAVLMEARKRGLIPGGESRDTPAPTAPEVSGLESFGRGALQGVTFGFGDEIYGGLAGAADFITGKGFNYEQNRDSVREANRKAQEANPGTYLIGEIGGGVAVPFGVAGAAARAPSMVGNAARITGLAPEVTQAATFGQRVGTGARMGASYGGLYGAGTSEGENIGEVVADTAKGVAGGAVLGGATVPAVDLIAATGRAIAAPLRAKMNPKAFAAEKIQEGIIRDRKQGPGGLRLEARANAAAKADPDTIIADVTGRSTQRLMRSAINQQSDRAEPFQLRLDQRKRFEGQKIERGLRDGLKLGEDDIYRSADDLAAEMDDIGSRLIEPALDIETPITPQLDRVLQRPKVQELMKRAENSLKNEDLPVGLETRTRMLHKVKVLLDDELEALDEIIKSPMATDRTAKTDFRELSIIKRDLLNAIDNPDYKDALKTYASPAQLRSAAIKGKNEFLSRQPQEIEKDLGRLTDAQKKMYRHGAMQSLIEKIGAGNPMNDKVRGVLSSDNMMGRVRLLFDDVKEFRKFQKLALTLARQSKTRQAAQGNSTTAQQLSDMTDAQNVTEGVKGLADAATGNWRGLLDKAGRLGSRATGMSPDVASEVLRILGTRPDVSGIAARSGAVYTPELRAAMDVLMRGQARRNAVSRGLVSGVQGGTFTPLRGSMSGKEELDR